MHTYWELLPLEKKPTKHVHILANQTISIPMYRPRVHVVKDLMIRGRLNESVLDTDSPLFI